MINFDIFDKHDDLPIAYYKLVNIMIFNDFYVTNYQMDPDGGSEHLRNHLLRNLDSLDIGFDVLFKARNKREQIAGASQLIEPDINRRWILNRLRIIMVSSGYIMVINCD